MKRSLFFAVLGLAGFSLCYFLFYEIADGVLGGFTTLPALKGEASDLALTMSLFLTLIVGMALHRFLRNKR
jgi:hypothetical protein